MGVTKDYPIIITNKMKKKSFLLKVILVTSIKATCQSNADSLALEYFMNDSNDLKMHPCELGESDANFLGNLIWYIKTKNCRGNCFENRDIQLVLNSDSISWIVENDRILHSKYERLHQKSALYSNNIVYEYKCRNETYRIYVSGRLNEYYLLQCYKFRKVFKSNMKLEMVFVIKEIDWPSHSSKL